VYHITIIPQWAKSPKEKSPKEKQSEGVRFC